MEIGDLVKIKRSTEETYGVITHYNEFLNMYTVCLIGIDKDMYFYAKELEVINEGW